MNIVFKKTDIEEAYLVKLNHFRDKRGVFTRVFDKLKFEFIKKNIVWKQSNISINPKKNTFRGLHYQRNKHQENKLVTLIHGGMYDFIFELRKKSKTYVKIFKYKLEKKNYQSIYILRCVAHGFYTLRPNTSILHNTDKTYNKVNEGAISIFDSYFKNILSMKNLIISKKDTEFKPFDISIDYLK